MFLPRSAPLLALSEYKDTANGIYLFYVFLLLSSTHDVIRASDVLSYSQSPPDQSKRKVYSPSYTTFLSWLNFSLNSNEMTELFCCFRGIQSLDCKVAGTRFQYFSSKL